MSPLADANPLILSFSSKYIPVSGQYHQSVVSLGTLTVFTRKNSFAWFLYTETEASASLAPSIFAQTMLLILNILLLPLGFKTTLSRRSGKCLSVCFTVDGADVYIRVCHILSDPKPKMSE